MRHLVRGRKLSRTISHREALRRNLVQSLIEHGEVRTTVQKAKEVKAFAEKLITLAIKGTLAARQRAEALLRDRSYIPAEHQEAYDRMSDAKRAKTLRSRSGRRYRQNTTRPGLKFTAGSILQKLFVEVGPQMKQRNEKRACAGGYTRIIRLNERRLGDAGELAVLQLVSGDEEARPSSSDKSERKRRARVKYAVYAGKPRSQGRRRSTKKSEAKSSAAETASE